MVRVCDRQHTRLLAFFPGMCHSSTRPGMSLPATYVGVRRPGYEARFKHSQHLCNPDISRVSMGTYTYMAQCAMRVHIPEIVQILTLSLVVELCDSIYVLLLGTTAPFDCRRHTQHHVHNVYVHYLW